jgi:hypothetical protein
MQVVGILMKLPLKNCFHTTKIITVDWAQMTHWRNERLSVRALASSIFVRAWAARHDTWRIVMAQMSLA